jgi:hypothetical protein
VVAVVTTNPTTNLTSAEVARLMDQRRITHLADMIERATAELRTLAGQPAAQPADGDGPPRTGLDDVDLLRGFCDHVAAHPHLSETVRSIRVESASGDTPAVRGQVYPWHDRFDGRHLAVLAEWVDSLGEVNDVLVMTASGDTVHLRVTGRMTGGLPLHLVAVVDVVELPPESDTFLRCGGAVWPVNDLLNHTKGAAQ